MKKIITITLLLILLISSLASAELAKSKTKKVSVKLPALDSQKTDAPKKETVPTRCAREGQYTYTSAVPCCEGLELDDQNRCKHPTPKKFVTLPESASQGCPAELRRMQEKLNQILRIAQT